MSELAMRYWPTLARLAAALVAAVVAIAVYDLEMPSGVVTLGATIGITYGLLAVGLVLVYRSNRIINFAHGEVGAFAAALFGLGAIQWGLPYYLLLPFGLVVGALASAATEVAVVRRLRNAPKLMSIVATLGVAQVLVFLGTYLNSQAGRGDVFPQPPGLPSFNIGLMRVTPAYTGMMILAPIAVVALALFLRYSRYGLAMRAAASNPEAARMTGIPAARMSALSWALAGALSAMTAILTQPTRGFTTGETFGPSMLLRALAVAVLARMNSLPVALAGGVGLGVLEHTLRWNYPQASLVEVVLFVFILVALLIQQRRAGRDEEKGSWAAVRAMRPVPVELRRLWIVRHLGFIAGAVLFGVGALIPLVISNADSIRVVSIIGFAAVGLSVVVITGLGGQLSLGQFAVAAVGAWASFEVVKRTGSFELAFLVAGGAGAAVSLAIGLPALRLRGLFLAVTTLAFALVLPAYFLPQDWMFGGGVNPGRPVLGSTAINSGRLYLWFVLPIFGLGMLLVRNVQRGGFGRLLVAVRDNEDVARSFTIRASAVKIQGFLVAGFIAGVGGALFGHALARLAPNTFPTSASISVVAITVIGGVSLTIGPLIGSLFVIGLPAFVPLDSLGLVTSAVGQLLIIMYLPNGLGGLVEPVRDRVVKFIGRRAGLDVDTIYGGVATAAGSAAVAAASAPRALPFTARELARPKGEVILTAVGLTKHFGGVRAVQNVSFEVLAGETLGLIGPNGAGKTTTFELLSGFTKPDAGKIEFEGREITRLSPEARGHRGLIRSFQDAALFPTLSVADTVRLALEREHRTPFLRSVSGLPTGERAKQALVDDVLDFMGLGSYRASIVQELSTGTRRITEIACLIAMRPTLLLLDEPSSGVAQRETEALTGLLEDLKRELNLTLVVIEHDMPMIMRLADRIVVMADGQIISEGTPEQVSRDPLVIEAYLGGSAEAIGRSDAGGRPADREPEPVDRP